MEAADLSLALRAYRMLAAFVAYRGLEAPREPLLRRPSAEMSDGDLGALLQQFGHLRMHASSPRAVGPRDTMLLLLLAPDSKYVHHSGDLQLLLKSAAQEAGGWERVAEVRVLAPPDSLGRGKIAEVLQNAGGGEVPAHMHSYYTFSENVPASPKVPRHEVADPREAQAFLAEQRLSPSRLLQVHASDPPIVWLGARPGQYVWVFRPSETTGETVAVRLVVDR